MEKADFRRFFGKKQILDDRLENSRSLKILADFVRKLADSYEKSK